MFDKHSRLINYMRVSLTNNCNLRCIYCMPKEIKNTCLQSLSKDDYFKIIREGSNLGINKIRFTGGEPLLYKDLVSLMSDVSKLPNINDLSITTNGLLLKDMISNLKNAGLTRANISLDSLKNNNFFDITRGGNLEKVLNSIDKYLEMDFKRLKINTLIIKGINDNEIIDFVNFTKDKPVSLRFIELMPLGEGEKFYKDGFISTKEIKTIIEEKFNLKEIDANVFKGENFKGDFSFISPLSNRFCSSCNRIRLTARGTLKPCLHSDNEYLITSFLNEEVKLNEEISKIIFNKPSTHYLKEEKKSRCSKSMFQIGG